MDSIVSQTLEDIEIICVDDGSTDNSYEILRGYELRDRRVTVLRQANQYAGVARNNGLKLAAGEYIIFWDADDYYEPECLEKMYDRAKETGAEVVVCGIYTLNSETGERLSASNSFDRALFPNGSDTFSADEVLEKIFQVFGAAYVWDKLIDHSFVKENQFSFQDIRSAEDVQFVFPVLAKAKKISVLHERLITHRLFVPNSLESTKAQSWVSIYEMFNGLWNELTRLNLAGSCKRSFDNFVASHLGAALGELGQGEAFAAVYQEARDHVIDRYGLLEHPDDYYYDSVWLQRIQDIKSKNILDYLASELQKSRRECFKEYCRLQNLLEAHSALQDTYSALEHWTQKLGAVKRWVFPKRLIPLDSQLVIYGAGDVGRDFYVQLSDSRRCSVAAWVDRRAAELCEKGYPVCAPEELKKHTFDYVVIAVREEKMAEAIRGALISMSIPEDKLLWVDLLAEGEEHDAI